MRLNKYSHSFHPALSLVQVFSESVVPRTITVSVLPGNLSKCKSSGPILQLLNQKLWSQGPVTCGLKHLPDDSDVHSSWRTTALVSAPALDQSLELNFSDFTVLTNCTQSLIHGLARGPYFEHRGCMLYCTSMCLQ